MVEQGLNQGRAATWVMGHHEPSYIPTQPYSSGLDHVWTGISNSLDYTLLRNLEAPTSHDFPSGYLACDGFFKSLGQGSFRSGFSLMKWRYDQRREAQAILPYLYVGPTASARDVEFVKSAGITCLLGIRGPLPHHARVVNAHKCATALGIETDNIVVANDQEFIKTLPDIIQKINEHICCCPVHHTDAATMPGKVAPSQPWKKVLIFCETGNERSAAVAIAYLMAMLNYDVLTAFINVQGRRLCCNLPESMKHVLQTFESILAAKRDVVKAQNATNCSNGSAATIAGLSNPKKRAIDAMQGLEDCVGDVPDSELLARLDQERFISRSPQPPFNDVPGG
ncbi:FMI2 protein [Blastomyces dermatitidis ER-3]|uniref:FMI2 protein n=1 Tax=Ajellomyces dermatitidis (strain ER-3 / ATCC MYA-2586) TaxID=559297 RepID=A0ABP2ET61_AJEDR|nr:FMI2 protein [Blastomyces dermatitidis ER-3]EEQ86994.1 FMI2 protein [Blastomyces dermatitidis ER-3]